MINGLTLKNAFISGANNISKHKNMVNDLNIFPVPDGDTGTNMSMTMSAAANELIKTENTHAGEIAKIAASALLSLIRDVLSDPASRQNSPWRSLEMMPESTALQHWY